MISTHTEPSALRHQPPTNPSPTHLHYKEPHASSASSISRTGPPSLSRHSSTSDVKLPSIRSLPHLDDAPRPLAQRTPSAGGREGHPSSALASSSVRGGSSPHSPAIHHQHSGHHRESLPSLSQMVSDGRNYHGTPANGHTSRDAPRQHLPPLRSPPSSQQATYHYHPFFDSGPKPRSPAPSSIRRSEELRRARLVDQLVDADAVIGDAHSLVQEAIHNADFMGNGLLDDAIDTVEKAVYILRKVRERHQGSRRRDSFDSAYSEQPCRSRQEITHGSQNKGASLASGVPPYVASNEAPSGSIWTLKYRSSPSPGSPPCAPPSAQPFPMRHTDLQAAPRSVYEGQSAEPSKDAEFRPPTAVIRTHPSMPSIPAQENSIHDQEEASYMYAPPSIRSRLASMSSGRPQGYAPPLAPHPVGYTAHPAAPQAPGLAELHQPYPPVGPPSSQYAEATPVADNGIGDHASKYKKRSRAPAPSACKNCGTNETPEWRRGPDGARTLCNACGLHFAKLSKRKPNTDITGEELLAESGSFIVPS